MQAGTDQEQMEKKQGRLGSRAGLADNLVMLPLDAGCGSLLCSSAARVGAGGPDFCMGLSGSAWPSGHDRWTRRSGAGVGEAVSAPGALSAGADGDSMWAGGSQWIRVAGLQGLPW